MNGLSARARTIVVAVVLAGAVSLTLMAALTSGRGIGTPGQSLPLAAVFAVFWAFPLTVLRKEQSEAIHVDEAFFIVSALLFPPATTMAILVCVPLVVMIVKRMPMVKVAFNVGQLALATSVGLAVCEVLADKSGTVGPADVGAAVAGAAALVVVTNVCVAAILSATDETTFLRALMDGWAVNGLVFASASALGVLTGVAAAIEPWTLLVALGPLAVLQHVFGSLISVRRERSRIDGLLTTALEAHRQSTADDVEVALLDAAQGLLGARRAEVTDVGPGRSQIGSSLPGDDGRWLVVSEKRGLDSFGPHDQQLLDAIVSVGSGAIGKARLITQIQHQAFHDDLTGLPNRPLFEERVSYALSRARRGDRVVAVLFLDLDRFKKVNDSLGHNAGNELLRQVGARLSSLVGESDTVARIGGDEFCVLLDGLRQPTDANRVANRILAGFEEAFELDRHELFITPSIGIASTPLDGDDPSTLLKHADMAMYRAKEAGRNTLASYSDGMASSAYHRLTLEASLHNAIDREELTLLYQPQVDLATGRVVGVEALVRWPHPTLGMVSPAQFIPLAEETGLIRAIDSWVMRTACQQAADWMAAGTPLKMAVNLSGHDFAQPRLFESIADHLANAGLPPQHLEIEVTESVAVDHAGTSDVFHRLKELGCRLAIDDFGTGYSMLSRLQHFPLDKLKIDKSFIDDVTSATGDAPIVAALISMAHGLGLEVCAEGVETAEQWGFLDQRRCDLVQGYYFARPLPPEAVPGLVLASRGGDVIADDVDPAVRAGRDVPPVA